MGCVVSIFTVRINLKFFPDFQTAHL